MVNVRLSPQARRQYARLPKTIKTRVFQMMERLKQWPAVSGAKPLRHDLAGKFRLRTGDYRLQFHVEGQEEIIVERIGHRAGFYEE
jgi:mRNA-degrading endonuclease RelE of RelBE toxin-antitoxin system